MFLLRRELQGIEGTRIAWSFAKVAVASAVMGAVTFAVDSAMLTILPGDSLTMQIVRLGITITMSMAALIATAQLLRIQEYGEARDLILGRLKRMKG
jgi:peptidoglycan biosynthesis protein MviN/MurJ (putative lipid II flippase)